MSEQTVTINGTVYDARTGMPLADASAAPESPEDTKTLHAHPESEIHHSKSIHQAMQKSQTLNRRIVKKTIGPAVKSRARPHFRPDIQKSSVVTKFAPHPAGVTRAKPSMDIAPVQHPAAARAAAIAAPAKLAPKPAQVIKQEAVAAALEKAPSHSANTTEKKSKKRYSRMLSVASAGVALLLLGGYFTYLNMPNLSVRVAAAQAGVNASYPAYHPDGYSLNGPVAYSQGQVTMKFAANGGPQNFTVAQAKSSWDSSAVLDNYVKPKAGGYYSTYVENGLTIYTFDGNAAWVNGGILYTIDGDAPLSSDQIRRIAVSM